MFEGMAFIHDFICSLGEILPELPDIRPGDRALGAWNAPCRADLGGGAAGEQRLTSGVEARE